MSDAPILTPFLDDADVILYAGDCVDVMRRMPEASVDAIVTDPPYELGFMGKAWDGTGLAARAENTRCILIEREPEYLKIIRDRLAQLSLLSELLDDE